MACEILIAAKDLNHSLKGYPKQTKDVPAVWGTKECPPDYVKLRITDCDKSQVEYFLTQWYKTFKYNIIAENAQGYRIQVGVDPAVISVSGLNREIRSGMKAYIQDTFNANIFSYEDNEVIVDIPKPIMAWSQKKILGTMQRILIEVTLAEMKADIHDKFSEVFAHRHFQFDSAAVDYALTQPDGIVERTKAQVLAMIRDKLNE